MDLAGVLLKEGHVVAQALYPAQRHPAAEPSLDGGRLVLAEVDAHGAPQEDKDLIQISAGPLLGEQLFLANGEIRVVGKSYQLLGDLRNGHAKVHDASGQRTLWH